MGHSVVDSSLLALPSDGGLSAIFGGFSEDEDEDDAGSERRLATPGGLGALDVATSLLVVAALSRSARAALAATGSALASAIRSEVCWRAFLLERLPQGSRLDFRRSWQSTALAAVRGGAKRRCSRCPEQGPQKRWRRTLQSTSPETTSRATPRAPPTKHAVARPTKHSAARPRHSAARPMDVRPQAARARATRSATARRQATATRSQISRAKQQNKRHRSNKISLSTAKQQQQQQQQQPSAEWLEQLTLVVLAASGASQECGCKQEEALAQLWADVTPARLRRGGSKPLLGRSAVGGSAKFFRVKGWPEAWMPHKLHHLLRGVPRHSSLLCVVAPLGKTVRMTLSSYLSYARAQSDRDDPLYLFDSGQAAASLLRSDLVSIPTQFFEDLFEAAPEQLIRGLERQYLTIGPQRSGARFHVDPFAASAVSLLLHGRKAWALFPPGSVPPGVRSAKCGDRVVHESPPATWWWRHVFLGGGGGADLGGVSFIQDSGDVVFTPSGWWHCTLNLSPGLTVALTRHVCTPALAPRVAAELRREGWGDAASWLAQELRERHS
ncbi:unnamed protein product [Polarella glacialis]|uniref:JmjC domain-containing protein n=1 Tax=Polarella glacialis TaxID=89957 RepID=A0A813EU37_POLGL|nr:unnamed protein product [Polarella glacialis]